MYTKTATAVVLALLGATRAAAVDDYTTALHKHKCNGASAEVLTDGVTDAATCFAAAKGKSGDDANKA